MRNPNLRVVLFGAGVAALGVAMSDALARLTTRAQLTVRQGDGPAAGGPTTDGSRAARAAAARHSA